MTKEEAVEILDAYRRGRENIDEAAATLYAMGVSTKWVAERAGSTKGSIEHMRHRHERGIKRKAT